MEIKINRYEICKDRDGKILNLYLDADSDTSVSDLYDFKEKINENYFFDAVNVSVNEENMSKKYYYKVDAKGIQKRKKLLRQIKDFPDKKILIGFSDGFGWLFLEKGQTYLDNMPTFNKLYKSLIETKNDEIDTVLKQFYESINRKNEHIKKYPKFLRLYMSEMSITIGKLKNVYKQLDDNKKFINYKFEDLPVREVYHTADGYIAIIVSGNINGYFAIESERDEIFRDIEKDLKHNLTVTELKKGYTRWHAGMMKKMNSMPTFDLDDDISLFEYLDKLEEE